MRAGAHRLDEIARHAGEGEEPVRVARALQRDEWADDLVHVAARTEIATRPGNHHRLDRVPEAKRPEGIA